MKEKWLDNKQALDYILNKLRSKYDILGWFKTQILYTTLNSI
jgi:hypothetical protein